MRVQFNYNDDGGTPRISEIDATDTEVILLSNSTHAVFPHYETPNNYMKKKAKIISKTLYSLPNEKIFVIGLEGLESTN